MYLGLLPRYIEDREGINSGFWIAKLLTCGMRICHDGSGHRKKLCQIAACQVVGVEATPICVLTTPFGGKKR